MDDWTDVEVSAWSATAVDAQPLLQIALNKAVLYFRSNRVGQLVIGTSIEKALTEAKSKENLTFSNSLLLTSQLIL